MYEIVVEGEFSAAHSLKLYDGTWEPRHGHDFRVAVTIQSDTLDSMGVVADFESVKPDLKRVLWELDEKFINDHHEFIDGKVNPSTENIAKLIYDRLMFLWRIPARIVKVTVWETPDAYASYVP